jgi:hypothetical protein
MASFQLPAQRLILAGGFAIAIAAAPAIVAFATPSSGPMNTACPTGESEDLYTGICTAELVPNSPAYGLVPGSNGQIAEINGIPCTGRNTGQCIGLNENAAASEFVPPKTSLNGQ